jgi:RHS repeat-associated protein
LISSTDRNGRKRTYTYDALNRETAEHWLDTAGSDLRTFNYSYDAVGHLLDTNDPDSHYSYTYDLVNRITAVDNLGTAGVPNVLLNYSYDAAENLLSVTDKINGVQKGTNAYTYDSLNRATRITQSGTGVQSKRVDLTYDAVNQMTGLSRYGDLAGTVSVANSTYTYDTVGRLTNLEYKRGASTLASYGLVYDAANRITKSSGTDGTQDYIYDSTNQLTGADHTTQADEAYSYDANGNRTNAGYGTGTNNQLLTDGTYDYIYDGEGNRTRRTEIATGKVTEYVWDYRNRLTSVLFKDAAGVVTKTIDYIYDVSDRRIGKKVDGGTTERYVYDGSDIALVFDGAGNQTHRYLYGTGVDTVLADETLTAMVWALADNQGTIRDLIDNAGNNVSQIDYDSFGRVVSQTGSSNFRYGYTGREQDNETGLDYYRARYYDSANGRFISEDPLGFGAGDSNLTRYVGNSPTNGTDPSGLCNTNLNQWLREQNFDNGWGSLGINTYSFPFNKLTYTTSPVLVRQMTMPLSGWRTVFEIFDASHPTEHSTKFLDFYFRAGKYFFERNKKGFDLEKEGVLDSIKTIPAIRKITNDFNMAMQQKIKKALKECGKNYSCSPKPVNSKDIIVNGSRTETPNLTRSGNFVLGHTTINMFGEATISAQDCKVKKAKIVYKINDSFTDVADIFNCTTRDEELLGGEGYAIYGQWVTGIGKY